MPQLRFGATLLVCASIFAQEPASVQGIVAEGLEKSLVVELSTVVADKQDDSQNDTGDRYFAPTSIDPEKVEFTEFQEGRYVTRLRIDAQGMPAARIHFQSLNLPQGAELYVYSLRPGQPSESVAGSYRGTGPLDGEGFWSDAVPGGTIIVELQVAGEVPALLPFEIDLVQQLDKWNRKADALPQAPVEKRRSIFRGQEIEHEVRDGQGIFEGDILLGDLVELEAAAEPASEDRKGRSKSAIGQTSTFYRWPNGIIPYVIESTVAYPASVAAAINHWNSKLAGVISLVPRTNQTSFVRFIGGSGCSSYIGKIGAAQTITLSSACSTGNIIHEIGHTVGLYHEQSREDRNTWVKVNTANITSTSLSNFNQFPTESDDLIYYAYNSIMHYHATAFSSNGQPTLETIPAGIPIGQRAGLDISDIAAVRRMYGKQTATVSVSTVPEGLTVLVDGVPALTPANFNWPAGSVHTISAPGAVAAAAAPSQHSFVRWTDGGALTHTVTAPATGLAVAAVYAMQHKLTPAVATASTGTAAALPASPTQYYAQAAPVTLAATPAAGYCFSAWTGLAAGTPNQTTVAMTRSLAPKANFIPGAITPAVASASIPKTGGAFTMNTTATTGCGWMIKSSATWLKVSKTYATSAAPSFTYTVDANATGVSRTATLTIDSKSIAITQAP